MLLPVTLKSWLKKLPLARPLAARARRLGKRIGLLEPDLTLTVDIPVNEQLRLTEFRLSDKPALVEYLNDRDIYERNLGLPRPYTEASADEWLDILARVTKQQRCPVSWAIRQGDGPLIGGIGFDGLQVGKSHRGEIGYWLARPLWGRGIMTAVVQKACQHALDEFGLVKITAHVLTSNPASARVLEKCGFVPEGYLKKHYRKDGRYLDAWLYARVWGPE